MDEQAVAAVTGQPEVAQAQRDADDAGAALVDTELLVEEVSIDGMCGVY
jgi:mycofactocin precursor